MIHWTEYVQPSVRDRLLAFADATCTENCMGHPIEPEKDVPYADQRSFINAIVAAESFHHGEITQGRLDFAEQVDQEIAKALSICERYHL